MSDHVAVAQAMIDCYNRMDGDGLLAGREIQLGIRFDF